jgi:hypothetical protein
MRTKRLAALAMCALLSLMCSNCAWFSNSTAVNIATGAPDDQADVKYLDHYAAEFDPEGAAVKACEAAPSTGCRNDIIYAHLSYFDTNYNTFTRLVLAGNSSFNAATDISVLGLNAAGTLVGGATTKAILAAISGGIVGTNAVINKDILYNQTINTLILQMDADRAAQKKIIIGKLSDTSKTYADYPLSAAENDAIAYYEAGTLPSAIKSFAQSAAQKKTDATK